MVSYTVIAAAALLSATSVLAVPFPGASSNPCKGSDNAPVCAAGVYDFKSKCSFDLASTTRPELKGAVLNKGVCKPNPDCINFGERTICSGGRTFYNFCALEQQRKIFPDLYMTWVDGACNDWPIPPPKEDCTKAEERTREAWLERPDLYETWVDGACNDWPIPTKFEPRPSNGTFKMRSDLSMRTESALRRSEKAMNSVLPDDEEDP
ncbi:hypothetical protein BC829DRAFT_444274 [Chytridium lagenaria]|nr:hypothetical protein BC829DRAFT_444274 [Chytridium lagenaria]